MSQSLLEVEKLGQSLWLDYISRPLLDKGELSALIEKDHLKGVTSNPSIFEKAISKTDDYQKAIEKLSETFSAPKVVYENLAITDIQDACDLFRPTFEETNGSDGFVSLEVSPHLAHDFLKTVEEGQRLWQQVDRPNLMIKVPGTSEGNKAITALISMGINVNVTLLFSVEAYENAALAYLLGLKERSDRGLPLNVKSVASFFISRIDSKLDALLEKAPGGQDLLGKVAIANAKLAYLKFLEIYQSDLGQKMLDKGADYQRLLWASTSTKNKKYSDVLYVESLIGEHTVNTLPLETLISFRDHGHAESTLGENIDDAKETMAKLSDLGINFEKCCDELLDEGIKLFINAFDQLIESVANKLKNNGKSL